MKSSTLGELTTLHYGKALSDYKDNRPAECPFKVFGTNGSIGWTKKPLFCGPSIIIGRKGAYRETHWAENDAWVIDTAYHLSLNQPEELNLRWLYYKLKTIDLNRLDSGAAIPSTKREDFYAITIQYPSTDVQNLIVDRLNHYDDLIENNRRRIQLLEESARLLYQEWFIHLRFPGHEQIKTTDGVPEGWEQSSIGEQSSYLNRGITPKYSGDGEYVVINQKCIRNRVLSLELARRQSKEYKEEKAVRLGDILINSTGTGTLGRVAQVWEEPVKTCVDTHVTIVRPTKDTPYLWLGYCLLGMEKILEDMGEGATNQKELKRQYVADISILRPPHSLMEMFHNTVIENTKQIQNLINTNKSLSQARDLLLPKLMSGELTV